MVQFYDLSEAPAGPPIPLAERPLVMPLPTPPICGWGDVDYILERVPISDLEAWRKRLGLRFVRSADLCQHGKVAVYEYTREGEDDAEI